MDAIAFKNQWSRIDDNLQPISLNNLEGLNLKQPTIDFLTTTGLPADAAPFLSFIKGTHETGYAEIAKLNDLYDLGEDFERYVFIGFDSAGDPIAVDTADQDQVVCLDHDDNFAARYMNNDILTLAFTLMLYRDFILEVNAQNEDDVYFDENFDDIQFENLQNRISKIDCNAVAPCSFWKDELNTLLANRAHYQNSKT